MRLASFSKVYPWTVYNRWCNDKPCRRASTTLRRNELGLRTSMQEPIRSITARMSVSTGVPRNAPTARCATRKANASLLLMRMSGNCQVWSVR